MTPDLKASLYFTLYINIQSHVNLKSPQQAFSALGFTSHPDSQNTAASLCLKDGLTVTVLSLPPCLSLSLFSFHMSKVVLLAGVLFDTQSCNLSSFWNRPKPTVTYSWQISVCVCGVCYFRDFRWLY